MADKISCQFSAIFDSVKANKDKTLTIKFGTQELGHEEASLLLSFMSKQVWVGISETAITQLDIPDDVLEFSDDKTPSQRLRSRMWVYFKEKHGNTEGFNLWYSDTLEKIGSSYLERLTPKEDL
jgi:hypothetical protein